MQIQGFLMIFGDTIPFYYEVSKNVWLCQKPNNIPNKGVSW